VSVLATSFVQSANFIDACYIVAFSLFIYGMGGLTGPGTTVRGNKIAASGMAISVVATLLTPRVLSGSAPWLILIGVVLGTAIGIPAALNVKMTAMPEMVALFKRVGGGAVAIIAWIEYRHAFGGTYPLRVMIPSLFAAVVGSVSFWESNIAFGKLQEVAPSRPIKFPGQAVVT
jgi:NAD(P) transhydrogenase subunit beta